VDYTLLDAAGGRIGHPYCYRDARNVPAMEKTFSKVSRDRMYEITGIQLLPFNTVYQLVAHVEEFPQEWERAARGLRRRGTL
jgi:rhamnulokinase